MSDVEDKELKKDDLDCNGLQSEPDESSDCDDDDYSVNGQQMHLLLPRSPNGFTTPVMNSSNNTSTVSSPSSSSSESLLVPMPLRANELLNQPEVSDADSNETAVSLADSDSSDSKSNQTDTDLDRSFSESTYQTRAAHAKRKHSRRYDNSNDYDSSDDEDENGIPAKMKYLQYNPDK